MFSWSHYNQIALSVPIVALTTITMINEHTKHNWLSRSNPSLASITPPAAREILTRARNRKAIYTLTFVV